MDTLHTTAWERKRSWSEDAPEVAPPDDAARSLLSSCKDSTAEGAASKHGDNEINDFLTRSQGEDAFGADSLLAEALRAPRPTEQAELSIDPHGVWRQVLAEFALEMPSSQLDACIQASRVLHYEDGHFIVGLPNAYYLDWAQARLRSKIKRKLASIMQRSSVDVSFRVAPALRPVAADKPAPLYEASSSAQPLAVASVQPQRPTPSTMPASSRAVGILNSKYTFESFVVGKHNRLAFTAAEMVVREPGQRFNPLYIYGGVGLGKTHLLNAIGNRLVETGCKVLYCSAEQFTNDLVNAIRERATDQFRAKYREIDVLLVDDIQFIVGKESTQEELFHTFNHLHAAGKQVVFTSDCPPAELPRIEERLRNRFEGGLKADIVAPDFDARLAILRAKADRQGMQVPQEVLELIARRIESNVRELEGALNHVWMHAVMQAQPVDSSLAAGVLERVAPQRSVCAPARTIERVAAYFGLTSADLTGRRRTADIAHARQVAMYLLRTENSLSLPAIGEHLGGRDHSTVSHGIDKIAVELQRSETVRQTIVRLREQLYLP
ncbi:MAG: chromosomal replication initiator protein DnaA [Caldilinea sp.]|nr:chromosomal replication initiator protein DnaA [Caldilinea sp.]MDW8441315.1 chromosomal replication initiator protein DnaA [Caldilineaceae bacterium]